MTGSGFSYGWAELALNGPPPLVPSSLMASWEAIGPPGRVWADPATVATSRSSLKFWTTPLASSSVASRIDSGRSTKRTPRVRSTQKLPMVSARRRVRPADQGDGHGQADPGRDEVLHRQPGHLGELAHGRLAHVVLPVGVGHERHGGVQGQVGVDGPEAVGVDRQQPLDALEHVQPDDRGQREHQQRAGVRLPGLLAVGLEAKAAVDQALDRAQHRVKEGPLPAHDPGDEGPQRRGQRDHGEEQDERLDEVGDEHLRNAPGAPGRRRGSRPGRRRRPGRAGSPSPWLRPVRPSRPGAARRS